MSASQFSILKSFNLSVNYENRLQRQFLSLSSQFSRFWSQFIGC